MDDKTPEVSTAVVAPQASSANALRIAVASKDNVRVDAHFGHAEVFLIYDVDARGSNLLERREVASNALPDEDPRETIYRLLSDCKLLLVAKIGVTPQEQLASRGVEASNLYAGKAIDTALAEVFASRSSVAAVDFSGYRMLHAMFRVSDLDKAMHFYTQQLGMTVLDHREHKKNQFSQVYLGYGSGYQGMTLELVFNWMQEAPYTLGDSYGHIAIEVSDIESLCNKLASEGVPMPRPPRAQRHGENTVAFVEDPDGHRIQLVQRPTPVQITSIQ
jgi:lactoylglutathione lyase